METPAVAQSGAADPDLIQYYEAIARASQSMLEAAYLGDWDQVDVLEMRCFALIEALKAVAAVQPLDAEQQERRVLLLKDILENDAQIRAYAEPWLNGLKKYLR
jgi:flagellar protein FliT